MTNGAQLLGQWGATTHHTGRPGKMQPFASKNRSRPYYDSMCSALTSSKPTTPNLVSVDVQLLLAFRNSSQAGLHRTRRGLRGVRGERERSEMMRVPSAEFWSELLSGAPGLHLVRSFAVSMCAVRVIMHGGRVFVRSRSSHSV